MTVQSAMRDATLALVSSDKADRVGPHSTDPITETFGVMFISKSLWFHLLYSQTTYFAFGRLCIGACYNIPSMWPFLTQKGSSKSATVLIKLPCYHMTVQDHHYCTSLDNGISYTQHSPQQRYRVCQAGKAIWQMHHHYSLEEFLKQRLAVLKVVRRSPNLSTRQYLCA